MIMYNVIKKSDYYVKAVGNSPVLVSTLDKATLFKVGEAEKYIKNRIRKNVRNEYQIVQTEIQDVPSKISDIPKPEFQKSSVTSELKDIKESVHKKLSDKQNMYKDKLQYYDDVILDIRHYIRDENTRLNACQAANVLYRLQRIERKRAEVKCELQRINQVFDAINTAISKADDFSYVPYKPRVIENMDEFLKKPI